MKVKNFVIPWVLQSFAYFTSVVAAPSPNRHGLEARAPPGPPSSWPGIGVELEVRQFKLRNQNENAKNVRLFSHQPSAIELRNETIHVVLLE